MTFHNCRRKAGSTLPPTEEMLQKEKKSKIVLNGRTISDIWKRRIRLCSTRKSTPPIGIQGASSESDTPSVSVSEDSGCLTESRPERVWEGPVVTLEV